MKLLKFGLLAVFLGISINTMAATQGALSATSSVGTFTNTFGATAVRQVQILALLDTAVTNNSPSINAGGVNAPGVIDNFCLVDTTGGAVTVRVSNSLGGDATGIYYAEAADRSRLEYFFSLGLSSGGVINHINDTGTLEVLAGKTVTGSALCGAGNMLKAASLTSSTALIPASKIFSSVITLTATPK